MEKEKKLDLQVGIFVFIGLLMIMVSILFIGAERAILQRNYNLFVMFPDIYGLQSGAIVRLSGLEVGRVTNISFPESLELKRIVVRLTLNQSLQNRVREDSIASIKTLGVLGDKYISLTVGGPESAVLPEGGFLKSEEPSDIEAFLRKGDEILDNIISISSSVRTIVTNLELEASVEKLVKKGGAAAESLQTLLHEIKTGKGLIHDMIYSPKDGSVFQLTKSLKESSIAMESIMGKIDSGQGTLGALVNDSTLYDNVKSLFGGEDRNQVLHTLIRYNIKKRDELDRDLSSEPADDIE